MPLKHYTSYYKKFANYQQIIIDGLKVVDLSAGNVTMKLLMVGQQVNHNSITGSSIRHPVLTPIEKQGERKFVGIYVSRGGLLMENGLLWREGAALDAALAIEALRPSSRFN
ncbi:hypothetical protein DEO72_LG5g1628 [Vigna unguiculata]|uniref:Uncharacterized protein n=1 Tax=Vigna unguiculata TaxID=3917 RepID=A0A4D6LYH8_VIGUN|nr:hypothetical protein DEO72_LG5g1628 [Vigna unguiculata]